MIHVCSHCKKDFDTKRDASRFCSLLCWLHSDEHKAQYKKQFKGKKLSAELRAKLSKAKLGKKQPESMLNNRLTSIANFHRSNPTPAESHLLQFTSVEFFQKVIAGKFIADFCFPNNVIVEVDGDVWGLTSKEKRKQAEMEKLGYKVIRVKNSEALSANESFFKGLNV